MKMNRKAAIELSISTIVIIVLAMSMLILGLVLIRTIFTGTTESVKAIDTGVKNEINKLFNEDTNRRLVLYPDSNIIKLRQGESGDGFALSIKNVEQGAGSHVFTYNIIYDTGQPNNCGSGIPLDSWGKIDVGRSQSNIQIANGNTLQPVHVRFTISNIAPICTFRLRIAVTEDGQPYETGFMDVQILPA